MPFPSSSPARELELERDRCVVCGARLDPVNGGCLACYLARPFRTRLRALRLAVAVAEVRP